MKSLDNMSWLHHPSGKIAVWIKDPVIVQDDNKIIEEEPKKRSKKK